jgi:hypothetical protein
MPRLTGTHTSAVRSAGWRAYASWIAMTDASLHASRHGCARARPGPTLECEVRKVATGTVSVALTVAAETTAAVTCDHPRVRARACPTRVCTL